MRIYKDVTIAFVNNPGTSKAGKPYYSLKWGPQEDRRQCWAKKGELDGVSAGDIVTVETLPDSKGGENLVRVIGKKAGSGAPLKNYRQDERPDVVFGKQAFGFAVATYGYLLAFTPEGATDQQLIDLGVRAKRIGGAIQLGGEIWDRRQPITTGSATTKSLAEAAQEALDDAIPY